MDKIAQEIFAPLLASMAGKPLTRAIDQYQKIAALDEYITIRVPKIEVTVHPRGLDGRDAHFDRTGFLDHQQTQRAYELLVEAYPDVFEAIATRLAKGEIK